MMRAQLRFLFSPDSDPIEDYVPEDPERFGILVQAMIGPEGTQDYESFDFMVCSPKWLEQDIASRGYRFGKDLLLLSHYDYRLLVEAITGLCNGIEGPDWSSIGERLTRYGRWEFQDYVAAPFDRAQQQRG